MSETGSSITRSPSPSKKCKCQRCPTWSKKHAAMFNLVSIKLCVQFSPYNFCLLQELMWECPKWSSYRRQSSVRLKCLQEFTRLCFWRVINYTVYIINANSNYLKISNQLYRITKLVFRYVRKKNELYAFSQQNQSKNFRKLFLEIESPLLWNISFIFKYLKFSLFTSKIQTDRDFAPPWNFILMFFELNRCF